MLLWLSVKNWIHQINTTAMEIYLGEITLTEEGEYTYEYQKSSYSHER